MINHVDIQDFDDLKFDVVEEIKDEFKNLNGPLSGDTEILESEIRKFVNVNYFDTYTTANWINIDVFIEEIIKELEDV